MPYGYVSGLPEKGTGCLQQPHVEWGGVPHISQTDDGTRLAHLDHFDPSVHDRVVLTRLQRDWQDLSYDAVTDELALVAGRDSRLDQALECGVSAEALEGIIDDVLQTLGGKASAHWVAAAEMRSA